MPRRPLYDGEIAKFNLRVPAHLYAEMVRRARREGLSVNQWLVRLLAQTLEPTPDAEQTQSTRS